MLPLKLSNVKLVEINKPPGYLKVYSKTFRKRKPAPLKWKKLFQRVIGQ